MDRFLEAYNLTRQNHEEWENLNRPITSKEIETVIKKPAPHFPVKKKKSTEPDGFTGAVYPIFTDLMPVFLKLFQKIEKERTLPNSFYEANITLIPQPEKDITQKRKFQANIPDEHRYKNSKQNTNKSNTTTH